MSCENIYTVILDLENGEILYIYGYNHYDRKFDNIDDLIKEINRVNMLVKNRDGTMYRITNRSKRKKRFRKTKRSRKNTSKSRRTKRSRKNSSKYRRTKRSR